MQSIENIYSALVGYLTQNTLCITCKSIPVNLKG